MYPSAIIRDITNFIFCEDIPSPADIILVPGGGYPEIAERRDNLSYFLVGNRRLQDKQSVKYTLSYV